MAIVISASRLAELLIGADPDRRMYVRVLSAGRLGLGADPLRPSLVLDLSKEMIRANDRNQVQHALNIASAPESLEPAPVTRRTFARRSGDYWYEVNGHRVACYSLKELLKSSLCQIEKISPGMTADLARVKARSRRIVAREPDQLFNKPHLVKNHAERLVDGWWYGTNNSAQQTEAWLRRACVIAGLRWEIDFRTSFGAASDVDLDSL